MTDDHQRARRLELSVTQLLAGAAAAATGAWLASTIGVAGTVVGAALVSVVVTVSGAVYAHGARRTARRFGPDRAPRPTSQPTPAETELLPAVELEDARGYRWGRMALAALAVFATAMAGITVVELATGQPLACAFDDSACTRTATLVPGRSRHQPTPSTTPAASATPTSTPSGSATPTPTPSASPSPTPSPSASGSDSASASQSGASSPSPSTSPG